MTIKITIDGEVVHEIDARAYRKRIMHVDLRDQAKSLKQEHIDLPIIRDLDVNIVFDSRADTDLHMLEEKARLDETDKDAERYEEASKVPEFEDEPENVPEETEEVSEEVSEDSPADDPADDSEPDGDDEPAGDEASTDDDGPLDLG